MSSILRGVVVARETRALVRPQAKPAAARAVVEPAATPRIVAAALTEPDPAEQRSRGYEDGFEQGRKAGLAEGFREAQARGHEEGHAAGLAQAQRESQLEQERAAAALAQARHDQAQRVDQLLEAMDAALRERLAAADEEMLALCFEAVTAVFGELATRSEGVRALVQQVLAQSRLPGPATVHLHPRDLELIDVEAQWPDTAQAPRKFQFVADDSVALGGCVIATPHGGLDARIETQLARLAEVFRRARDEERHG